MRQYSQQRTFSVHKATLLTLKVWPFPETLQDMWGRIYSEWFPSSGYEAVKEPEILWNENTDVTSPKFKSEIWIPVIKRK